MRVSVRLYATLGRYRPGKASPAPFEVDLPQDATVECLLRAIGLPVEEARVVFVNGRARPGDWRLACGDRIGVFPPIGGG